MTLSMGKVIMLNCCLLQSRINRSITFEYHFHHIARCIRICFPPTLPFSTPADTGKCCLPPVSHIQKEKSNTFLIRGGGLGYLDMDFHYCEGMNEHHATTIKVSHVT